MSATWNVYPLAERRNKDLRGRVAEPREAVAPAGSALSYPSICDAIRRMTPDETAIALAERVITIAWAPGVALFAAGVNAARRAVGRGLALEAVIDDATLLDALQRTKDAELRDHAVWSLADRGEEYSAAQPLTRAQKRAFRVLAVLAGLAFGLFPGLALAFTGFALAFFFLVVIGLKFMSLWPTAQAPAPLPLRLPDALLPSYSVLVPLFRETEVAEQLLAALLRLDYPRDRLDIKLILEAGDLATRAVIADAELPPHMEVIVVPNCGPQTKPKALNYALQFARGELVTVFDAEDNPDPGQLRLAAETFASAGDDCACLQARLRFNNYDENWLTRQFAIEYACHFELLLPMLASMNLPLPLGGTSNHFRAHVLREAGAWDPHNVTEDADLGIRLARLGYRSGVIAAATREEANCRLGNSMAQRSRWLKGWLQTWFVHMREPARLWRELGFRGFVVVQATMLGVVLSALVHPIFTILILLGAASGSLFSAAPGFLGTLAGGTGLAVLVSGYLVAVLCARHAVRRLYGRSWWIAILFVMPVYWLLMSVTAWIAVWQFIRAPFHWNKTKHGLSQAGPNAQARRQVRRPGLSLHE